MNSMEPEQLIPAIEFEVYDTGIGMTPEALSNLFQMFSQLGHEGANINKDGVGLGLYVT